MKILNLYRKSSFGRRLANGVFWSMSGAGVSRALTFSATIIVARLLGKSVFGELGMIQSTVSTIGIFAGFGLSLTATKYIAELRRSNPVRTGRILGLSRIIAAFTGSLFALGLFLFAPWLAEHTINAPHLISVLRIGALILFFNAVNSAQIGALAGFEAFKEIAYVNLLVGLFSFPILVCGAYFGGITGVVWAIAINLCFHSLLNIVALHKQTQRFNIPFSFGDWRLELPILWKFSLPAVLQGILVGPANWASRAFLTNQPNGYDEMGIFMAAFTFHLFFMFISGMLNAPLLSMVSNAGSTISNKFKTVNILTSWMIGVVIAIPLLCFPEIAQMVFGNEYDTYKFKLTFSLIVFCSCILLYKSGLSRSMVAHGILWWGVFSNSLWAVIMVVSAFFFVPWWGAPGLALSLTIAYLIQTAVILPLCYSRKLVPKWAFYSLDSTLIWLVIVGLVFLNITNVSITIRSIIFIPSLLLVGLAFVRIGRYTTT